MQWRAAHPAVSETRPRSRHPYSGLLDPLFLQELVLRRRHLPCPARSATLFGSFDALPTPQSLQQEPCLAINIPVGCITSFWAESLQFLPPPFVQADDSRCGTMVAPFPSHAFAWEHLQMGFLSLDIRITVPSLLVWRRFALSETRS